MERLINSDSMVMQLYSPINLRYTKDGSDMSSETSVLTRGTWYKAPDIGIIIRNYSFSIVGLKIYSLPT
jgi:hypothetical protein